MPELKSESQVTMTVYALKGVATCRISRPLVVGPAEPVRRRNLMLEAFSRP